MPNQWGTQQAGFYYQWSALIGGADVACPANTETNIWQYLNVQAFGPGTYLPGVVGSLTISLGATPPSVIGVDIRVNNGADLAGNTVPAVLLIANANILMPITLYGGSPSSPTLFFPGSATIQVSVNPTGQAVTARNSGTNLFGTLIRVQDGF